MEELVKIVPVKITAYMAVFLTALVYFLDNYFQTKDVYVGINYAIIGLVMGIVLYSVLRRGTLKYSQFLFLVIYAILLILGVGTIFYSVNILPYLSFYILLLILSDQNIAFVASINICLEAILNSCESYYLAIIVCAIIIMGFYINVDKLDVIVLPVIAINLFALAGYFAIVFNIIDEFSPDIYIYPVAGFVLNIIISIVLLFAHKRFYLQKYEDIYISINDPEYNLLIKLKEKSASEYKIAIHTAYLCDRICTNLSYRRIIAKCMGYYHRIGVLEEGKISDNTIKLAKDNSFPPALLNEMIIYEKSGWKYPKSKEATVLNYCSEVIKSILLYYQNYKDKPLDYEALIDKIFDNKYANNTCRVSEMTLQELDKMKQYLKDEKLYYDFLR